MPFYAHTSKLPDGTIAPHSEWEPLFTPFGPGENECQHNTCKACADLETQHGHLNKVAPAPEILPSPHNPSCLSFQSVNLHRYENHRLERSPLAAHITGGSGGRGNAYSYAKGSPLGRNRPDRVHRLSTPFRSRERGIFRPRRLQRSSAGYGGRHLPRSTWYVSNSGSPVNGEPVFSAHLLGVLLLFQSAPSRVGGDKKYSCTILGSPQHFS